MTNQQKAYGYAGASILCWSTIASAFKITLYHLDFLNTLLYASVVATLVLLIILLAQGKWQSLTLLKSSDYLRAAVRGFLNPFMYYIVLLSAYEILRAQEAGTLNYIWPIMLVLFSVIILKQRITWLSVLAIFVSFAGILIIATEGRIMTLDFREPMGVILAAGSSVFWALYWILNMKDKQDEVIKLFLNFSIGSLFVIIYLLITGRMVFPGLKGFVGAVYIGVFEMGLTFYLWLKGLKLSENAAKVANLVYLSPFISLMIIRLAVGEQIMLSTILGLTLIIAGILLQRIARPKTMD